MSQAKSQTTYSERNKGLFIALMVVSFVLTISFPLGSATPLKIGLLIVASVAYTLIGLLGGPYIERTASRWASVAYLIVELVLGGLIIYLSEARGMLILVPLAGFCVEELPIGWAILGCALTILVAAISVTLVLTSAINPDGSPVYPLFSDAYWEQMLPVAMQFLAAFAFVVLYTLASVRERKIRAQIEGLASELRTANRQLREYASQAEELATAHERNRLAREIHDGLGHYLTGIHMQIQAGRAVLDLDRDAALEAFDQAQTLAQEGLTEVRRSVAALRASPLDAQSLCQAIEALVDECRAAGVETHCTILGEPRDLTPQADMTLYRVAQEALTNVRRHSQATHAQLTLDFQALEQVELVVRDDGVGADAPGGGYGLVGVRERVDLLGGQLAIETAPGEGFCLNVRIPTVATEA